ncbi:type IV pilus assembly protein PilV [Duganella sp. 1411]|jgi:type IV pilus assembly protein PilV|uniref:type IV pilus modification PilV family protein n=1 Tax=Duganella sp. 1411 TaxID=2806572 RepID=UPI001AEA0FE2|nr:prepilin-type N-terminal cleavage/methylation domain-containing protein [Duganella sp. 1411]MBP1203141.1 type IV pilus assembly protein PilV [Duganella sp. 1411]
MRPVPARRRQGGIALLEAMLAIVILGIGLLGTIGLQARAYSALSDAGMRAEATMAGEKLLGVMTADAANLASYNLAENGTPGAAIAPWLTETRAAIPGALVSVTVVRQTFQTQVDIAIRWQRKANTDQNRHLVTAYIAN